jgi:hypothetical protein
MAEKFSQFTTESTLSSITGLVGYISGSPGTNVRISPTDLITGTTNTISQVLAAGSIATNTNTILIQTSSGSDHTLSATGSGAMEIKADRICNIQGAFDDVAGSLNLIVGQAGADFNVLLTGTTPSVGDVLEVSSVTGQTGTLQWATPSGGGLTPTTQTTNYTAAASDFVICNVTTSLRVTLPAASAGAVVGIKYASQSSPTDVCDILTPSAGVTIDGTDRSSTALVLPSLNTYYELISDGTNWFIK